MRHHRISSLNLPQNNHKRWKNETKKMSVSKFNLELFEFWYKRALSGNINHASYEYDIIFCLSYVTCAVLHIPRYIFIICALHAHEWMNYSYVQLSRLTASELPRRLAEWQLLAGPRPVRFGRIVYLIVYRIVCHYNKGFIL